MANAAHLDIKINEKRQKEIEEIIFNVANKLKDPYKLKELGKRKDGTSTFFPITLSHGYPGTIIFFTELDRQFPNENWDLVAHEHFLALEKELQNIPIYNISLFTGLTGITFATFMASRNRERYNKFLSQLESLLYKNIDNFIQQSTESWLKSNSAKASMFDVIGGLSGIGRYLLLSNQNGKHTQYIIKINEFLIKLTNKVTVRGIRVPGWYVSSENLGSPNLEKIFPQGNFNYGLAHGISGPLAFLAISLTQGIKTNGQVEAIELILDWLLSMEEKDQYGAYWRGRVAFEEYTNGLLSEEKDIPRESWCYGTPGILRAMYLAGKAINDKTVIQKTFDDFKTIYRRPSKNWGLESPIFCHGKAGLLQITLTMEEDNPKNEFLNDIIFLTDKLIKQYNVHSIFGYQDIEPIDGQKSYIDKAGILEGVAGIALSLLSLVKTRETLWDCAFLLK
ncbi:lanthionine synthetase C family protein [Pseudobacillus badius]|uniref:lanthionine synthetase C family protein n=1 Tax=Bacillus badius TaxID=1455 RepID=UPI003D34850B